MRVTSVLTDLAHQLTPVDVAELVALPLGLYAVHRLQETVKNHMEPERTLLRPRVRG